MVSLPFLPKLNINADLVKLFDQGRIDKVYEKMYRLAQKLADEETNTYNKTLRLKRLSDRLKGINQTDEFSLAEDAHNYKKARLEHHMNEMKALLLAHQKKNE